MFEAKIRELQQRMPEEMDGLFITGDVNRTYLSGLRTSAGTLLITRKSAYFFADFRYIELVRERVPHMLAVQPGATLGITIEDILDVEGVTRIGFEDRVVTVAELARMEEKYPACRFCPMGGLVDDLRRVKESEELLRMIAAQRMADHAYVNLLNFIKAGRTELEVRDELERLMRKEGSEEPAFPTIVISGRKTSMPHGVPSDKVIEEGDFVTMDFGATSEYYKSDMTRTVAVGHATEEMERVYQTVYDAQQLALSHIRAGVRGDEIDAVARDFINAAGYKGCFGHGLGHSVGLEIHEAPSFSPSCHDVIEGGTVITVEPGIYLEGKFGVRIEDIVSVNAQGVENYTASPKHLMIL